MKKNNKTQFGFTLVELLVMIGIFLTITTVAIVNLRSGTPGKEVQLQSNNLTSLLRQAQVQSMSGEPFNGAVPIGGYGVEISTCSTPPCTVLLFADVDGDFEVDAGAEEVQVVSFGTHVTIDALSAGSPTIVLFKPPRPYICVNMACSGVDETTITLGSTNSSRTRVVTINQVSGQISS